MFRTVPHGAVALLLVLLVPGGSWGTPTGGPHLWLSTDPRQFDEGGAGYVGDADDPWLDESYVTQGNPFTLYLYHALKSGEPATDIQLLVVVHEGESGVVTVGTAEVRSFPGVALPPQYGGGNHGVYDDPPGTHDGRYAVVPLDFDLEPQASAAVRISWYGFSEVHFDAISSNGFWNPPSHDATGTRTPVPEPSAWLLWGVGLGGYGFWKRKKRKTDAE